MNPKVSILAGLLLLLITSGCETKEPWKSGGATKALWTTTAEFNGPSTNPKLQVFRAEKQNDFLVVYDECYGRKGLIRRRAYYLFKNEESKKSHIDFVSTNSIGGLARIPLFEEPIQLPEPPRFYVIAETNSTAFKLCSSNALLGTYRLPVYKDAKGLYARIALTPLAATADAAVVTGYVAIVGAYLWVVSGCPGVARN